MNRNIAITLMIVGATLRLTSNALSWPSGNFSFSGPRESTVWAIREAAINDIGMGLFWIGGILLIGALLIPMLKRTKEEVP